jgi:uncharacterized membrane protein YhiD involved in acid resistance
MAEFLNSIQGGSVADVRLVLLSIILAFVLSHLVALAYSRSHTGLSYSRSFVHTLVLGGPVAATLMLAIGNNLVWGIGIVGTLAIVRFRTNLRDPRDMVFVFAALAAGIAAGVGAFVVGVIGTVALCLLTIYLHYIPFGARNRFDGLLRFTLEGADEERSRVEAALRKNCTRFVLTSLQQVSSRDRSEHSYQLRFRRDESRFELVGELERTPGLENLSLYLQEAQVDQ